MRILVLALAFALVVAGCKSKSKSKADDELEVKVEDFVRDPGDQGIVTPIVPAPHGAQASPAAREHAVLDLLGGKMPTTTAELAATDPGMPFDWTLRVALTRPNREPWRVEVDTKASGVDEAAATAFVAAAKPYLEACPGHGAPYVMRQNKHVVVTVRIGEAGAVRDARRTSMDTFDWDVLKCIDQKLSRLRVDGSPAPGSKLELALRYAPRP